jgi:hypothetical protein
MGFLRERGLIVPNYAAYYKAKLEGALLYQDFVVDVFYQHLGIPIVQYASKAYQNGVGESRCGIEIKFDELSSIKPNLWIEIAEKATQRDGPYIESGIYRNDNAWLYVIGNYNVIYVLSKNILRRIHQSGKYSTIENGTLTSKGILLPQKDAHKYADIVLTPQAENKINKLTRNLSETGKMLHEFLIQSNDRRQLTLFDNS